MRVAPGWLAALWCCMATVASANTPAERDLLFRVLLDDTPIGEHRFSVRGPAGQRKVVIDASFAVKLLGITVYRYRHQAVEQWQGDCLAALESSTDDDGQRERVLAESAGDVLTVTATGNPPATQPPGCVMSFAYWNPAMRTQTRLLNAQTGRVEPVQIRQVESGAVEVRGAPVPATRWRISGPASPVDVWYTASGEWVGLDSTVRGGRRLSYRLK